MDTRPIPAARHVVVAVDGSDASKMAVLWAARNVLKPDENLHLVKVSAVCSDCVIGLLAICRLVLHFLAEQRVVASPTRVACWHTSIMQLSWPLY